MKRLYLAVAVAAFGSLTLAGQQQASAQAPQQPGELHLRIGGSGGPPKLGIAGFIPASSDVESTDAAKTIADVLYDDLNYEREYYMIGKDAIASVPKPTSIDGVPLDGWRELNADGVIVGSLRKTPAGVTVQVKLIQVSSGRVAFAKEYSGAIGNPRRYAHTISDDIFEQQLALDGVARTKLAFSSDRDSGRMKGPVGDRQIKEIYVADYDGANPQRVTNTKTLNVAPSWSPDGEIIAYSSWRPSGPGGFGTFQDIVLSVIHKGLWETPAHGNPNKQNYLPAWSPDGTKIAFTCTRNNNQDICVMNRDGSGLHPITTNPAVDVSPTGSPTGTQIAWVSDRTGGPQVYVMNADGTGSHQLTHGPDADRPTWSRGKFNEIAYAAKSGPGFDVMIYSFATGETTRVTDGIGSNESPAFSPNGRHIAFTSTRNGKAQIFTIGRDGGDLRQITHEGKNGLPNWSK